MPLSNEASLIKMLNSRYDLAGTHARPLKNSSDPIQVSFGMRLIQMDIDEKMQILKTSVWLRVVSINIL